MTRFSRSERRNEHHLFDDLRHVSASERIAPVQGLHPASACGTSPSAAFSPGSSGTFCFDRNQADRRAPPSRALWRNTAARSGMFSRWMYCQTSSSVQFESGNTRMLSPGFDARVEQVPQLRPLVLRVPLAVRIAEGIDAFLGARFFFVAPRAADSRVEAAFRQRIEQSPRLQQPAALLRAQANGIRAVVDGLPGWYGRSASRRSRRSSDRGTRSSREICRWYRCAAAETESVPG